MRKLAAAIRTGLFVIFVGLLMIVALQFVFKSFAPSLDPGWRSPIIVVITFVVTMPLIRWWEERGKRTKDS